MLERVRSQRTIARPSIGQTEPAGNRSLSPFSIMSAKLTFNTDMTFSYGEPAPMAPGVQRIVANNPGPFTFKGTNTYLVGTETLAVIDPGPDDPAHRDAILAAAKGRPITHVLITHTHRDHVDGLAALQEATGARSYGYGRRQFATQMKGTSPSGTEFIDQDFAPDVVVQDGDVISGPDWALLGLHTPGHAPDHLCFELRDQGVIFSGDHVMGWNTTVIAPPEGHMASYLASLERLLERQGEIYLPGHGGQIETPQRAVKAYLLHRQWREQAVLRAVRGGVGSIRDIVRLIYPDLSDKLITAASLSVQAHVEHLMDKGEIEKQTPLDFDTPLSARA